MGEQYQREIEEILTKALHKPTGKKVEKSNPATNPPPEQGWFRQRLHGRRWGLSPARAFFASVGLLLCALVMRSHAPSLVGIFAWTGITMFITAYALFFLQPHRTEKRWRGKLIEEPEGTLLNKIRNHWRR